MPSIATSARTQVKMAYIDRMYDEIKAGVEPKVLELMASTQYIMGSEVKRFEDAIADRYQFRHAAGIANGTDALMIGLRACGVGIGDEVIVPAFTIFVDGSVVRMLGAIPQFADVQGDFNLDPESFEQAITPKTKAVIVVHLFGQTADMDPINEIAKRHGIAVIEDACQAMGAKYGDRYAGALGDVGAFSFYPTKNLGGMGDGGLASAENPELFEQINHLHTHGVNKQHPYIQETWSYNSRLDAIQAVILHEKLKYLSGWEARRREIAQRYLSSIKNPKLRLPSEEAGRHHVWHMFTICTERREELLSHLQDRGIGYSIFYPEIVPAMPAYSDVRDMQVLSKWPVSERFTGQVVSVPVNPQLTDDEVQHVIDALNEF